jgi:glycosyltransferase involved in cell wall biosynthesis
MKIAIYTLTRDRLAYTIECFKALREKAGMEYDHYIQDNGSTDGTQKWLEENVELFEKVEVSDRNEGISKASNRALENIFNSGKQYDFIIKMDNDCLIQSDNILAHAMDTYADLGKFSAKHVLSPRVEGIMHQPTRGHSRHYKRHQIGYTGIVGGLFHIVPAEVYREYRFNESLPKAKGQDDEFCKWVKDNGGEVGYIEDLVVEHKDGTEGQVKVYPEYFERKWNEEITS